jgi:hypothetical protein
VGGGIDRQADRAQQPEGEILLDPGDVLARQADAAKWLRPERDQTLGKQPMQERIYALARKSQGQCHPPAQ